MFLKELSFRSADIRHAAKVVQEIKALRSAVQQREKEKAERATLVQQEKLVRGKVRVSGCHFRPCSPVSNGPAQQWANGPKARGSCAQRLNSLWVWLPCSYLLGPSCLLCCRAAYMRCQTCGSGRLLEVRVAR